MPVDRVKTQEQFERYAYARDNGHLRYAEKDRKCNDFLKGKQWDPIVESRLMRMKRPALKINKIFATVVTAMSQQLNNRADVAFKPVDGEADDQLAAVVDKLFVSIMRANNYDWLESDVFAYGIVGSRSYFDVRAEFEKNMQADIKIRRLHGRNVVLDPDASDYDPDTWKEIFITKWMVPAEIAATYNEADAKYLESKDVVNDLHYAFDSIEDYNPGSFSQGITFPIMVKYTDDEHKRMRRIRVIERQFRVRERVWHFVDPLTGDVSVVPSDWSRARRNKVSQLTGVELIKKDAEIIRWRVTADDVVLHDSISPYKHFTVVPYFPVLHDGETMGIVEHLLSVQEQLNKTESQILHIVNTTSNSGWKTKRGNITNMTMEELEVRGAETGLVLELQDVTQTEKIQPNQVPTGLDLVSRKADEYLKEISGFSDSVRGFDRADVAAKAIQLKQQVGQDNNAKYFDNLNRTRHIVARNVLDIIQAYYTEERIFRVTGNTPQSPTETFVVNQLTPEGTVLNDLTIGRYDIVVSTVPARDTFEQTQFQQAFEMRQAGIPIPDTVLIRHSNLLDKNEILEQMQQPPSPEQQQLQQLELQKLAAEVRNMNADASEKEADILLKRVQAKAKMLESQRGAGEDADLPSEIDKERFERIMRIRQLEQQDRALDIQEKQLEQKAAQGAQQKQAQSRKSNASRLAS